MGVKRTYAEVKEFVETNSDCQLLSTEYVGTREPLRFRCACGEEFTTTWSKFFSQNHRRCAKCGTELRASRKRKPLDQLKQELSDVGLEYLRGEYKNRKSKITILCRCGHERTTTYNLIFSGGFSGLCLKCADPLYHGANRLTLEEVRELSAVRGVELLSDSYHNAREYLRFRCACGREFQTTWNAVISVNKVHCDICGQRTSSGERAIETWLDEHGIAYEKEKAFPGLVGVSGRPYRFDFYIPSRNICIEFDGQQHSKVVDYSGGKDVDKLTVTLWAIKIRDHLKTMYCESNGIGLLRIDYTQMDELPKLLADTLIPR